MDKLYPALWVGAQMVCLGTVAVGAFVLLCYIEGELMYWGRKRAARKKLILEKGFEYLKARDEIMKRERRLAKEKEAYGDAETCEVVLHED